MDFVHNDAKALRSDWSLIALWGQSYGATMVEIEMPYMGKKTMKATAGIPTPALHLCK